MKQFFAISRAFCAHAIFRLGAAWIPIPVIDTIAISSIQTALVVSLYKLWGVAGLDAKTFAVVFLKSLGPVIASFVVGYTASSILKIFVGIGSIVGGILDTAVAATATLFIGVVITTYLSQRVYDAHSNMTAKEMKKDIQSFMRSDRFQELVNGVKNLAKNPKNISISKITGVIEKSGSHVL
jgi:uncharacterized protein (DUF697 family)